jgi:hypothetical protein
MDYKKLTKAQLIEELNKKPEYNHVMQNCHSELKLWDKDACESINLVAQGLLNLTELFKSQNIEVTGFKIDANHAMINSCSMNGNA